eukprot:ANDGO_07240.mRNA.1 hypothetical protein
MSTNITHNLARLQNLANEIPKFVPSTALQKMKNGCDGSPQMINAAVMFLDIENYTGQLASRRFIGAPAADQQRV